LERSLPAVIPFVRKDDGVYQNKAGLILTSRLRPGDLLVNDAHAALYFGENDSLGIPGVLDEHDLVLHTADRQPTIAPLDKAFSRPFEVLRFQGQQLYAAGSSMNHGK
jgi:hypothetical protein